METVSLFGLPYRYGLPPLVQEAAGAGSAPVDAVMVRAPLVPRMAELVPELVVYQIADRAERTRARLLARGTSAADVAARIRDNQAEVAAGRLVADRTFLNDGSLHELVDAVAAALVTDCPVDGTGRGAEVAA